MNSTRESNDMGNNVTTKKRINLKELIAPYRKVIDIELRELLLSTPKNDMYKHMAYFLGFLDENLNETNTIVGKRFRPGLTLLIADYYGDMRKALKAAVSIELFHNFTLIHDDIVDNDEVRRGRPTVWKLFGKNHAINSGDAQHALSNVILGEENSMNANVVVKLQHFLNERYLEIAEGQYLDFVLTEAKLNDSVVTKETYMKMITKKAAVLVGAATAVAGIANNQSEKEENLLYEYGLNLGIAYQLYDDFASIWNDAKQTGKIALGDIVERKKTLPVLYTSKQLKDSDGKKFRELYDAVDNTNITTNEIFSYIEKAGTYEFMQSEIAKYIEKADKIVSKLSLTDLQKDNLRGISKALVVC